MSGETVVTATDRPSVRAVLGHPPFAAIAAAALISNLGGLAAGAVLAYDLAGRLNRPAVLGQLAFVALGPVLVFGGLGGRLADRHDVRRLLIGCQVALFALALGMWLAVRTDSRDLRIFFVIVGLSGLLQALNGPCWQVMVSESVPRTLLPAAVGVNAAQFNLARAAGPWIGGLCLAAHLDATAFLLNAISYLFVFVVLARLPRVGHVARADHQSTSMRTILLGSRTLRADLIMALGLSFLAAPVPVFFAYEVRSRGGSVYAYSALVSAYGVGSVCGALVAPALAARFGRARVIGWSAVLSAVSVAMLPMVARGPGLLPVAVVAGATFVCSLSTVFTSMQLEAGEHERGRAGALFMRVASGGLPIGALLQGQLASSVGLGWTAMVQGGLLVVLTLLVHRRVAGPGSP